MISCMLQRTNDEVHHIIKQTNPNFMKPTTLPPQDNDKEAASEIYIFIKAVSMATRNGKIWIKSTNA